MKKRLLIAITLLIGFSMLFSTPTQAQAQEATDLDTMIVAATEDPTEVEPTRWGTRGIAFNVYDTLIRRAVNRTEPDVRKQGTVDQFEPSLATEWLINQPPDPAAPPYTNNTWYFKIRNGVKFHPWPGHPADILTTEDVEYSFERQIILEYYFAALLYEPLLGRRWWKADLNDPNWHLKIENAVQHNDTHVWFNLIMPYPAFIQVLAQEYCSIVNKAFVVSKGDWPADEAVGKWYWPSGNWTQYRLDWETPTPLDTGGHWMIGTGPYKFDYWVQGVEWSIVKFDDYWQGWPAPGVDGFVSVVINKIVPDWSVRKEMFLNGSADIVDVPRENITELLDPETGEPLAGIRMHKDLPTTQYEPLFFNFDILATSPYIGSGALDGNGVPLDFFSDINLRKAFAYSFNYTKFIEDAWLGEATQPATPVIDGMVYYNPAQAKYYTDLNQATAFFQAATGGSTGYPGAVWEKGFNFTITYNVETARRFKVAEILKTNIEGLHPEGKFHIAMVPVNWSRYLDEFWGANAHVMPLSILGWILDYPDPHNIVWPFMHSEGGLTWMHSYSNATVDALIEEGMVTHDIPARQNIYYTLQQMYYEDIPSIPLFQLLLRHWERDWVQGWYYNPAYPNGYLVFSASYFYHLWKVNTPAGSNVDVSIPTANVTITFDNVTDGGITNAIASSTGPPEPSGFMLGEPPTYYEINTTATYTDTIEICITYNETQYTDEENLRLFQWNGTAWQDVTVSLDTVNNVICGRVTGFSSFSVMELSQGIAGTVVDEYTGQPIEGVEISVLETSALTFTDEQGLYYFADVEPGSYTVEMTVPYGYLTHDAVTKFVEVPPETVMKVDFTLYEASWADATVPRTIGYWKNWDKHYTLELMATYIEHVKAASGLFSDLTVEDVESYFKITRHSTMEEKGQAQLLASWLNVVSAQLGVNVQVDLTSISGWETVIADDDGVLTVDELLRQIDNFYATDATLTKDEWETIKKILDALNNGKLLMT